jgi:hypothetical protein
MRTPSPRTAVAVAGRRSAARVLGGGAGVAALVAAAALASPAGASQSYVTRPDIKPPTVKVTTLAPGVAPGYVFVAPKGGDEQRGPMLYDNRGQLVFFQPVPAGTTVLDFKAQTYGGKPVLTWWQGEAKRGYGFGEAVIYDQSYRQVATVKARNGYQMDFHEFTITPKGTALFDAYKIVRQDLSKVKGGTKSSLTMKNVVQEVDIATGKLLLEWDMNEDIAPTESYDVVPKRAGFPYDYIHVNSVDEDTDGNLLISARATHTVYKIDRETGKIIWRLGGKKSTFKMGKGTRTAWQHDAHRQADGTITTFDNNADEPAPGKESRGVQVRVDETAKTATLVREWKNTPAQLSPSQGNMQVLANGNAFIGWGGTATNVTEFSPTGSKLFEASFTNRSVESYRGYRQAWSGRPTSPPKAVAKTSGKGIALRASWNGATDVAAWRVLGGASAETLQLRATTARKGFETLLRDYSKDAAVAVEALDAQSAVLGRSAVLEPGADW